MSFHIFNCDSIVPEKNCEPINKEKTLRITNSAMFLRKKSYKKDILTVKDMHTFLLTSFLCIGWIKHFCLSKIELLYIT